MTYAPICRCGLPMVKNPHPDAGKLPTVCEVGAIWECVSCLAAARHGWCERALNAERKLDEVVEERWRPISEAPKDGTPILAARKDGSGVAAVRWGRWLHPPDEGPFEGWFDLFWHEDSSDFDYWMPLLPKPGTPWRIVD